MNKIFLGGQRKGHNLFLHLSCRLQAAGGGALIKYTKLYTLTKLKKLRDRVKKYYLLKFCSDVFQYGYTLNLFK